jgi:molybdopterin synthase catalytic subunit
VNPLIEIVENAIDPVTALQAVSNRNAGSNLLFLGTTRQFTGTTETVELRYECYAGMAKRQMQKLAAEASRKWELCAVAIIHRIGVVPPGEASLAVAVSSPHRQASFEAGAWLIDEIKRVVPVWKQEVDRSGTAVWVHPPTTGSTE